MICTHTVLLAVYVTLQSAESIAASSLQCELNCINGDALCSRPGPFTYSEVLAECDKGNLAIPAAEDWKTSECLKALLFLVLGGESSGGESSHHDDGQSPSSEDSDSRRPDDEFFWSARKQGAAATQEKRRFVCLKKRTCGTFKIGNGSELAPAQLGHVAEISCDPGFRLDATNTINCSSSGTWCTQPKCSAITCPRSFPVANGNLTVTFTNLLATAQVNCRDGYHFLGDATARCQNISGVGLWSWTGYCAEIACPTSFPVANGNLSVTSTNLSATAQVICLDGSQPVGEDMALCQDISGVGLWNWTGYCAANAHPDDASWFDDRSNILMLVLVGLLLLIVVILLVSFCMFKRQFSRVIRKNAVREQQSLSSSSYVHALSVPRSAGAKPFGNGQTRSRRSFAPRRHDALTPSTSPTGTPVRPMEFPPGLLNKPDGGLLVSARNVGSGNGPAQQAVNTSLSADTDPPSQEPVNTAATGTSQTGISPSLAASQQASQETGEQRPQARAVYATASGQCSSMPSPQVEIAALAGGDTAGRDLAAMSISPIYFTRLSACPHTSLPDQKAGAMQQAALAAAAAEYARSELSPPGKAAASTDATNPKTPKYSLVDPKRKKTGRGRKMADRPPSRLEWDDSNLLSPLLSGADEGDSEVMTAIQTD